MSGGKICRLWRERLRVPLPNEWFYLAGNCCKLWRLRVCWLDAKWHLIIVLWAVRGWVINFPNLRCFARRSFTTQNAGGSHDIDSYSEKVEAHLNRKSFLRSRFHDRHINPDPDHKFSFFAIKIWKYYEICASGRARVMSSIIKWAGWLSLLLHKHNK